MTNNEVYARCLAYEYMRAKKYGRDIYWKLLDITMQELCFDKFKVEASEVSTGAVMSCLCNLGEGEVVAYALDYFDKHGRHFDTDMEL